MGGCVSSTVTTLKVGYFGNNGFNDTYSLATCGKQTFKTTNKKYHSASNRKCETLWKEKPRSPIGNCVFLYPYRPNHTIMLK